MKNAGNDWQELFYETERQLNRLSEELKKEKEKSSALQSRVERLYTEDEMIDFHNFIFRHNDKFLRMGEYIRQFKIALNKAP